MTDDFGDVFTPPESTYQPLDEMVARVDMPRIDPSVRYVGVSTLRKMNAQHLSELNDLLVLQNGNVPLAVLMGFAS